MTTLWVASNDCCECEKYWSLQYVALPHHIHIALNICVQCQYAHSVFTSDVVSCTYCPWFLCVCSFQFSYLYSWDWQATWFLMKKVLRAGFYLSARSKLLCLQREDIVKDSLTSMSLFISLLYLHLPFIVIPEKAWIANCQKVV